MTAKATPLPPTPGAVQISLRFREIDRVHELFSPQPMAGRTYRVLDVADGAPPEKKASLRLRSFDPLGARSVQSKRVYVFRKEDADDEKASPLLRYILAFDENGTFTLFEVLAGKPVEKGRKRDALVLDYHGFHQGKEATREYLFLLAPRRLNRKLVRVLAKPPASENGKKLLGALLARCSLFGDPYYTFQDHDPLFERGRPPTPISDPSDIGAGFGWVVYLVDHMKEALARANDYHAALAAVQAKVAAMAERPEDTLAMRFYYATRSKEAETYRSMLTRDFDAHVEQLMVDIQSMDRERERAARALTGWIGWKYRLSQHEKIKGTSISIDGDGRIHATGGSPYEGDWGNAYAATCLVLYTDPSREGWAEASMLVGHNMARMNESEAGSHLVEELSKKKEGEESEELSDGGLSVMIGAPEVKEVEPEGGHEEGEGEEEEKDKELEEHEEPHWQKQRKALTTAGEAFSAFMKVVLPHWWIRRGKAAYEDIDKFWKSWSYASRVRFSPLMKAKEVAEAKVLLQESFFDLVHPKTIEKGAKAAELAPKNFLKGLRLAFVVLELVNVDKARKAFAEHPDLWTGVGLAEGLAELANAMNEAAEVFDLKHFHWHHLKRFPGQPEFNKLGALSAFLDLALATHELAEADSSAKRKGSGIRVGGAAACLMGSVLGSTPAGAALLVAGFLIQTAGNAISEIAGDLHVLLRLSVWGTGAMKLGVGPLSLTVDNGTDRVRWWNEPVSDLARNPKKQLQALDNLFFELEVEFEVKFAGRGGLEILLVVFPKRPSALFLPDAEITGALTLDLTNVPIRGVGTTTRETIGYSPIALRGEEVRKRAVVPLMRLPRPKSNGRLTVTGALRVALGGGGPKGREATTTLLDVPVKIPQLFL
jgi:hypothetical protein